MFDVLVFFFFLKAEKNIRTHRKRGTGEKKRREKAEKEEEDTLIIGEK